MKESNKSIDEPLSFEEAMKKLEETVTKLEKGDVSLEEAIELYSEGMKLAGICSGRINEIESRITVLSENRSGQISENDFEVAQ